MSTYFSTMTAIGDAKLANAIALGGALKLKQMGVGDGNGATPVPDPAQKKLVNERRRADINQLSLDAANPAQVIIEQVLPGDVGGWWVREIGLYDEAGDLCAVANCPPSYKPLLSEGAGRDQVVRVVLLVASTTAVELKIDPSVVLATRKYADDAIVAYAAPKNHTHTDLAPLKSPAFADKPTAPTPLAGDNGKQLANTEFVMNAIAPFLGGSVSVFRSSGTFTVPAGISVAYVSMCGGGGGGGGSGAATATSSGHAASGGAGGAGAGEFRLREKVAVTAGQVLTVTIGGAGNGGTGGTMAVAATAGTVGGATSVSGAGVNLTAAGGGAGNGSLFIQGAYAGGGGASGATRGAGDGCPAIAASAYAFGGNGGNGGSGPHGTGGGISAASGIATGKSASGYGAGGGGAAGVAAPINTSTNGYAGGAGTPGIVIIEW